MNKFILIVLSFVLLGCNTKERVNANTIINKSIGISGGAIVDTSHIAFDFRGKQYFAKRNSGEYILGRVSVEGNDSILDIMTNNGFERVTNNKRIKVVDSMATKYSSSINSVHYFSVLPYGLDGKSVNKKFLGEIMIKDELFYKVKITFNEDGGGEDFEDVFIYYFGINDFKIKYLAYSYNEDDGTGFRFREAYNERVIEGIRFVDYNNYKPASNNINFLEIDRLFEKNKLSLLSKIELENIQVSSWVKD